MSVFQTISRWYVNARPIALMQSLMPAVLAVVLAIQSNNFSLWMGILAVVGVALAHLSMNLADDYFDYRVDMLSDRERVIRQGFRAMMHKYPYLTDGSQTPRELGIAVCSFAAASLLCGLPIFVCRLAESGFWGASGVWWLVAIVAVTGFLGLFYSAPPFKLAYKGLGELIIGVIFGPLLMMGTYYSASGTMNSEIVWISIPVGLLVLNILFTHSFIDMAGDEASNKMTFARLLGSQKACLIASYIFNILPFVMVLAAVLCGQISPLYMLILLVMPRALWLCSSLRAFTKGETDVPQKAPKMLGPMKSDWDEVQKAGIDWFLMRWLAARNTLSGFCAMTIIVKILLIIF